MTVGCTASASAKRRFERREQKRARRRAKRQAAARTIKDRGIGRDLHALCSAVSSAIYAVRSAVWLVGGQDDRRPELHRCGGGKRLRWCGRAARDLVLHVAGLSGAACSLPAERRALSPSLSGSLLSAGVCARSAPRCTLSRPRSAISFRSASADLPPEPGMFRAQSAEGLAPAFSCLSAKADVLTRSAGEALAPALRLDRRKGHALAPSLSDRIGQGAGSAAGHTAKGRRRRASRALLWRRVKEAPRVEAENAVSLPRRVRGIRSEPDAHHRGSSLAGLRRPDAGRRPHAARKHAISDRRRLGVRADRMAFRAHELSRSRSVRCLPFAVTPEGVRIKGFSIGAVNMSDDQSLGAVGGVIKPDLHGHDLELALTVEKARGRCRRRAPLRG